MNSHYGLGWKTVLGGRSPVWTAEPNLDTIADICRKHLSLPHHQPCLVTFHAQGLFNKLFLVDTSSQQHIFRVSLPIHLPEKVESEVATTRFLDNVVGIPVPNIIAFDPSNSNDLHFSCILMTFINGSTLDSRWRKISWDKKVTLVKRLANIQAKLYKHRFRSIGSLYTTHPSSRPSDRKPRLHRSVAIVLTVSVLIIIRPRLLLAFLAVFFYSKLRDYDAYLGRLTTVDLVHCPSTIARGPYPTTHYWLESRILRTRQKAYDCIPPDHKIDPEFSQFYDANTRLLQWLPHFFPPLPSHTHLLLHDIHTQNILIDENDNFLALVDFEMISTVPTSMYCTYPSLLHTNIRRKCPQRIDYGDDGEGNLTPGYVPPPENEGKDDMYWTHLNEYEMTCLREVYQEEMREIEPEWAMWYEVGRAQRKFVEQVVTCEYGFYNGAMTWLNGYEKGEDWEDFDCWEDTSYASSSYCGSAADATTLYE